ncbi:MAG: DUF1156 domain-containing protein [Anaerolineae bacterium]
MTPYPKRLIEVDLPIRRISAHARREKSIRHGHISTLHIWWARRPLAACRAVICAALVARPGRRAVPAAFPRRGSSPAAGLRRAGAAQRQAGQPVQHREPPALDAHHRGLVARRPPRQLVRHARRAAGLHRRLRQLGRAPPCQPIWRPRAG